MRSSRSFCLFVIPHFLPCADGTEYCGGNGYYHFDYYFPVGCVEFAHVSVVFEFMVGRSLLDVRSGMSGSFCWLQVEALTPAGFHFRCVYIERGAYSCGATSVSSVPLSSSLRLL